MAKKRKKTTAKRRAVRKTTAKKKGAVKSSDIDFEVHVLAGDLEALCDVAEQLQESATKLKAVCEHLRDCCCEVGIFAAKKRK